MNAGEDKRPFEVTEATLLAYVDGQLSPGERAAVETWLLEHPDKAADVGAWQRQNAALSTLYAPILAEPVPPRLDPRRIAAGVSGARWDWTRVAAAAVVLLAIGSGAGWFMRTATWQEEPASERLIDGAVSAHALYVKETRHAVEVAADDKAHLVTWLSNRVGHPIGAPDLTVQGFQLVGGRLLPPPAETGMGPAAQLMYQDGASTRVTVFITTAADGDGKPYVKYQDHGLEAYYWANDQITCTVVGDLPEAQMQTVAKGVYQQLTWRPDPGGRS